jgi:hypothetical protein
MMPFGEEAAVEHSVNALIALFMEISKDLPGGQRKHFFVQQALRLARISNQETKERVLSWMLLEWATTGETLLRDLPIAVFNFLISLPDAVLGRSDVVSFFEAIGTRTAPNPNLRLTDKNFDRVLKLLKTNSSSRGLLRYLYSPSQIRDIDTSQVPFSALKYEPNDEFPIRATVACFRLFADKVEEAEIKTIALDLVRGLSARTIGPLITNLTNRNKLKFDDLLLLAQEIADFARQTQRENYEVYRMILKRIVDRRRSNLDVTEVANRLELPAIQQATLQ